MTWSKRRWLIPEVIQTSAMDCGPAALKALLEAYGVSVSYGRLREACQTDVDGTSIDVIEETACRLGLKAQQVMLPAEHVLLDDPAALPAIVVTKLPGGDTHFVIAWRRLGGFVQVMDPALGRHWVREQRFLADLYRHTYEVSADDWRAWAGSEAFLQGLQQRIDKVARHGREVDDLIASAIADATWFSLAVLDAAVRMTEALLQSSAVRDKTASLGMLQAIYAEARSNPESQIIPPSYWSVLLQSGADEQQLAMRGAVLVTISGVGEAEPTETLSPDLSAALNEKPQNTFGYLWQLLREIGLASPLLLGFALLLGVGMVMVEALLFRGLLDLVRDFETVGQRLTGILFVSLLALALLLIEFSNVRELQRQGRQLEVRLRQAFLRKIPRLNDRYFHSRTISDMAERAHQVYRLRGLPAWTGQLLRSFAELSFTTAGIIWLDPQLALLAICSALLALGIPLLAQPALNERDLRARSHEGALSRFYLEAMLGLSAVRAHCAERAVRSQHEGLMTEWARASMATLRLSLLIEGVQAVVCLTMIAGLLFSHYVSVGDSGGFLLLIYWALKLPMLGQQFAMLFRQYPAQRNAALRFMEPLGARDEVETEAAAPHDGNNNPTAGATPVAQVGVTVTLRGVTAQAAGHDVLRELDLHIAAGSHVAIVGSSGAGKSSLVGLLLGWMQASEGEVRIDDEPLTAQRLRQLRRETAWLDPAVQLWNASLLDNLMYGHDTSLLSALGKTLASADLHSVLKHCPEGLQTQLGEGGAFLSGGEGQRVRLGRSLLRQSARLVILDEPFRGLSRSQREHQMRCLRAAWPQATLLCVTHDVSETLMFERVLVMDDGKIVEDAAPAVLAADEGSRFHALLATEKTLQQSLWADSSWNRLWMEEGQLHPFKADSK